MENAAQKDKDGIHDEAEQGGYRSNNERIGLGINMLFLLDVTAVPAPLAPQLRYS